MTSSISTNVATTRVRYVDWVRGMVITFALFSHFMLAVGGWAAIESQAAELKVLRLPTRTATPAFIVLFGASMQFAYARLWERDRGAVRRRLTTKAAKCYGAAILIGLAALIGASMTVGDVVSGATFTGPILNGNIYVFYTVAMLLSLLMVPARVRFGVLPTLAVTLAWWPLAWLLKQHVYFENERVAFFASRIFGIGAEFGPSVLHALPLVVAGMAVGSYVRSPDLPVARRDVSVVALLALLAFVVVVAQDGLGGALRGYVGDYRADNHFGYFAMGFLAVAAYLLLGRLIETRTSLLARDRPGVFGGAPLLAFTSGNVVINLFAAHVQIDSAWLALLAACAFLAALWAALRGLRSFRRQD